MLLGLVAAAVLLKPFDAVIELAGNLAAAPLTDSPNATGAGVQLFRRGSAEVDEDRKFMDWRKKCKILRSWLL